MEHIAGGDLHKYINKKILTKAQIALVMYQLLKAIKYLSSHEIVHRDIKPHNILVDVDPAISTAIRIKLTDFGLAKTLKPGTKLNDDCGTPYYIAPEIIQQNGYGKQIDMWSTGVLFFYLVCGTVPF